MPIPYTTNLRDQHILIVEDSYLVAQEMIDLLEREGAIIVGPAATLQEAQRLVLETSQIDAAVLDVNVRGDMIWPVADLLHQRQVRLVFSTGFAATAIRARYGQVPIAEKPAPARMVARLLAVETAAAGDN